MQTSTKNPKIEAKYYFDKKSADHAVNWFEKYITHAQGDLKGKPIKLKKYQKEDFFYPLFGVKHKITKLRRYKTVFLFIPKKNAKSTLAAGTGLYCLMGLPAVGVNVICAAADRFQAGIVFNDLASVMVEQNTKLSARAQVFRNSIVYKGQAFKVISSEASTKHGIIPYVIMIDEVHAHKNKELIDTLRTGVVGRDEPITIYMTTAGTDTTSVAYELYDYAKKVQSGEIIDESFLPIIYEAPKELDIFDPKTWAIANPGYPELVKPHYFIEETNKIKNQPSYESTFRRLHLNQWVGAEETWISDFDWMECEGPSNKKIEDYKGMDCYLGLDLASVRDITALNVRIPLPGGKYRFFWYFWLPMETAKGRSKSVDVNYLDWGNQGYIILTEGSVIDQNIVIKKILEINEFMNIKTIGYDNWNSTKLIVDIQTKIDIDQLDPVGMGFSTISEPTKGLEIEVMNKLIEHDGNPVARWMMGNMVIVRDENERIRPSKKKSKNKIDGIVAAIIAKATEMSDDDTNEEPGITHI